LEVHGEKKKNVIEQNKVLVMLLIKRCTLCLLGKSHFDRKDVGLKIRREKIYLFLGW
jgi:hypothetical protein